MRYFAPGMHIWRCKTRAHILGVAVRLRGTAQDVVPEGNVPQYHRRLQSLYRQAAIRSRVFREHCILYLNFAGV